MGPVLIGALGERISLLLWYLLGVFASALGVLVVAGFANGIGDVATNTILQERVPDAFLGRVFAVKFLG